MKLWTATVAPNPRRVAIFLAEKDIEIPTVEIDLANGDNYAPEFVAKNPLARVPVLEFDDGAFLAESMAICRYLEEIHPEPPQGRKDDSGTFIRERRSALALGPNHRCASGARILT